MISPQKMLMYMMVGSPILIVGATSVLSVLSDCLMLNWQNPKSKATYNLVI